MKKNQHLKRGFALVVSIFIAVALEASIAGGMLNMMRLGREVQHNADEMRMNWAAEAVIERTIKLLNDYVKVTGGQFPDVIDTIEGKDVVIKGDDAANELVSEGRDFEPFIKDQFSSLKGTHAASDELGSMDLLSAKIIQTLVKERSRNYVIEVKMSYSGSSAVQATITQEVVIDTSKLFDFSVFCNDDCEITAGPNFDLQGPIFGNKNIYLMNDKGSTLTFNLADTFGKDFNPEPYLMRSHGNIYFYFKRELGENYFLSGLKDKNGNDIATPSQLYQQDIPDYYKDPKYGGMEIYPGIATSGMPAILPYAYYYRNEADCNFADFDTTSQPWNVGTSCSQNKVRMFDERGQEEWLVNSGAAPVSALYPQYLMRSYYRWTRDPARDSSGKLYNSSYDRSSINLSTAFDPSNLVDPNPKLNPNPLTIHAYQNGLIQEGPGVQTKSLPIGDLADPHMLIESLAPGEDSQEKFHYKADTLILLNCFNCETRPEKLPNLKHLITTVDDNILKPARGVDFRVANANGDKHTINYELDVAKLINLDPTPKLVFVHTDGYSSLRVVNGEKLPREGLTIASDGRIWVKGDYNVWDYTQDGECHKRDWDDKACHFPPAAFFSDSFGILSQGWVDSYSQNSGFQDRKAVSDVMVNAALATGNKSSHLAPNYSGNLDEQLVRTSGSVPSGYLDPNNTLESGSTSTTPTLDGKLVDQWEYTETVRGVAVPTKGGHTYHCPDLSYKSGKNGVTPTCEYYSDVPDHPNHYYINPNSIMYKMARAREGSVLPCTLKGDIDGNGIVDNDDLLLWTRQQGTLDDTSGYSDLYLEANLNGDTTVDHLDRELLDSHKGRRDTENPSRCPPGGLNDLRIPVFIDPNSGSQLKPAPPFPGVYYSTLNRHMLIGRNLCNVAWVCQTSDGNTVPSERVCVPQAAEGGCTWQNQCPSGSNWATQCVGDFYPQWPSLSYYWTDYSPLYTPKYSGGIENLINLQEDWGGRTLRFLGTLSIPWNARRTLEDYNINYYKAPERKIDYNEDLRTMPPPGTPDLLSTKRLKWSRKF